MTCIRIVISDCDDARGVDLVVSPGPGIGARQLEGSIRYIPAVT